MEAFPFIRGGRAMGTDAFPCPGGSVEVRWGLIHNFWNIPPWRIFFVREEDHCCTLFFFSVVHGLSEASQKRIALECMSV